MPESKTYNYYQDPEVILDSLPLDHHLLNWPETAKRLIKEWYSIICELLPSNKFAPPRRITLKIDDTFKHPPAYTVRDKIFVSFYWIKDYPDDIGLVIHELVHVIQSYPKNVQPWITEGIADYIRWSLYEKKNLDWFRLSNSLTECKNDSKVTAGFFLWLETKKIPKILRRLNTAIREQSYNDGFFETWTGEDLKTLWAEYKQARQKT